MNSGIRIQFNHFLLVKIFTFFISYSKYILISFHNSFLELCWKQELAIIDDLAVFLSVEVVDIPDRKTIGKNTLMLSLKMTLDDLHRVTYLFKLFENAYNFILVK